MHRIFALLLLVPTLLGAQTRYASEALKLRAGASDDARVLARVAAGASVEVRDCDRAGGEWCLVVAGGQRGFVEARLLDAEQTRRDSSPLSTRGLVSPYASESNARRTYSAPPSSATRAFIRGPRGGCYTISANGNKRYVDRSLCN